MIKKIIIIICAVVLTAISAWAVLPALAAIAPNLIGATIATVVAGGAVTKIAQSPSGTFTVDGSLLKVPIVAYNKVIQGGVEVALGYAASIPWDFATAWNTGAFSQIPEIQAVAAQTWPTVPASDPVRGDTFLAGGTVYLVTGTAGYNMSGTDSLATWNGGGWLRVPYGKYRVNGQGYLLRPVTTTATTQSWQGIAIVAQNGATPTHSLDPTGGVPSQLSTDQASQLAANLAAAQSDQMIKDALKAAVASNPGLLDPPAVQSAAIPATEVDKYTAQAASAAAVAAAQAAADKAAAAVVNNPTKAALNDLVAAAVAARVAAETAAAAAPGDVALQQAVEKAKEQERDARNRLAADPTQAILQVAADKAAADLAAAKAAAQAATDAAANEVPPETFAPVNAAAFATAYNPGAFDIPARFTTFINRVKASPLFSFSTGFFNSLPGGGSPIYEIEAGQYGHHTIDLSQTMSIGLAVLKTILLACFGFLSIRAVIMKR